MASFFRLTPGDGVTDQCPVGLAEGLGDTYSLIIPNIHTAPQLVKKIVTSNIQD